MGGGGNNRAKIEARLRELDEKELEVNKELKNLQIQLNDLVGDDEKILVNDHLDEAYVAPGGGVVVPPVNNNLNQNPDEEDEPEEVEDDEVEEEEEEDDDEPEEEEAEDEEEEEEDDVPRKKIKRYRRK